MMTGTGSDSSGVANTSPRLIRTERRGGVLLATMDMPGRSMNVISWAMMDALEELIGQLHSDPTIECAVITSGKPTFLAGADLEMVSGFTDLPTRTGPAEVHDITGRLGRLFVRLEAVPIPTVAAINGLALGGGLELALACAYRMVAEDPRIQLGLPEVRFGLLPGAGGTQRLPRLVGIERGIEMMLSGRSVSPSEAREIGLIDEIVPRGELIERAAATARELARSGNRRKLPQRLAPGPFELHGPDAVQRITAHLGYSPGVTARYPAYEAIVRAVIEGAELPIDQGDDVETSRFVDLMFDPGKTAAAMVRTLFLNRQLADKAAGAETALPAESALCVTAEGPAAEHLRAAARGSGLKLDTRDRARIVVIAAARQSHAESGLVLLSSPEDELLAGRTGICLLESAGLGRALEIIAPERDEGSRALAFGLAKALRATPYCHRGTSSILLRLSIIRDTAQATAVDEEGVVLAQVLAARRLQAAGDIGDARFADVACVIGGIVPAWSGGPFMRLTLLGDSGVARLRARYLRAAPQLFS
jgi:3-hydroxyacyl-CoA dehydrogenase / enoyl-CoA hydratase / 3-hydroxybutyryl-CoA epimerase